MDIKEKYYNYSKENGKLNIKENINYFTIEKSVNNNCPKCENLVNEKDIYCKNCGEILTNVKSKREKFINQEETNDFKSIVENFDLIRGLKTSLLAFLLLFIFSLSIKLFVVGGNNQISQLINPIHLMLFSNLASMDIMMSLFMNSTQSSINLGFIIFLILPIVSLIISYNVFMRKGNTSFLVHLKKSLGTAVIYAFILAILARMSQIEISLSSGFDQYGVYLGFSTISTFIKGFMISFIPIFFIGLKKEYEEENSLIYILKLVMKTILIGYVIVCIILSISYLANIDYLYDLGLSNYNARNISLIVMISQLAIYLWSFANLVPLYINKNIISILSLFEGHLSMNLFLLLGSIIALSALIFIIVGSKLESKYKNYDIRIIIIFSAIYGIIMGLFGILTTLYVGDKISYMVSSITAIKMGYSFIIGTIISFGYSFIMTLVGYKLNRFN